jgi:hypothetical protein
MFFYVIVDNGGNHISALSNAHRDLKKPCMLYTFLGRNNNAKNYKVVKQYCCQYGIQNQCVNVAKSPKTALFNIGNLMKQTLNKHGIFCWWTRIEDCCPALGKEKDVIFIGVDVFHAPKKFVENKKIFRQRRSIGGFVSIIFSNGQMTSSCQVTDVLAGKELIGRDDSGGDSDSVTSEGDAAPYEKQAPPETKNNALEEFIKKTINEKRIKPSVIIVYRDGVGDGQMDIVKDTEVAQVKRAAPDANIIYSIVKKGIHSRFFVKVGDSLGNPASGTVINDLQHRAFEGFYLIPTTSNISSVRPVHYILLEGAKVIPMDQFQRLTFAMCHLYPNWPDTIKLPLPTQLAHKLCWQMGQSVEENPQVHENFFHTCFYL